MALATSEWPAGVDEWSAGTGPASVGAIAETSGSLTDELDLTDHLDIGRRYFFMAMAIKLRPPQGTSLSMRLTRGIMVSRTFS